MASLAGPLTFMHPAQAMSPPIPYRCPEFIAAFERISAERGATQALPAVLADASGTLRDARCLGGHLRDTPGALAYAQVLLPIVHDGQPAPLRANAAVMLGALTQPTMPLLQALARQLAREQDADAAAAIMQVLGEWLIFSTSLPWQEGFSSLQAVQAVSDWAPPGGLAPPRQLQAARVRALRNIVHAYGAAGNRRQQQGADGTPSLPGDLERQAKQPITWETIVRGTLRSIDDRDAFDLLAETAYWHMRDLSPDLRRNLFQTLIDVTQRADSSTHLSGMRTLATLADSHVQDLDASIVERLDALFGAALTYPADQIREEAARGLRAFMGTRPAHVQTLCALLSDEDRWVRTAAARTLAALPALPDEALPPLRHMAAHGTHDATAAAQALAGDASQETVATLVHMLGRPEPAPIRPRDADRFDETAPVRLADAAHGALRKIGRPAALPLLAHLGATRSDAERKTLMATLRTIGWETAVTRTDQLTAALAPALDSDDAHTRRTALALLAMWRPYADAPYPQHVAERAARDWFAIPADQPTVEPARNHVMFLHEGEAQRDTQLDAAIVIGNSDSTAAASQLVRWMCSGRRLQESSVINVVIGEPDAPDGQLDTIRDSLVAMQGAAALPVIDALAKGAHKPCEDVLFEVLAGLDLDGSDPALVARMLAALRSKVPGLRPALLDTLAHMPDLPRDAAGPLLEIAKRGQPAEASMALLALRNIGSPHPAQPGWPAAPRFAQARALPPRWVGKEWPRKVRKLHLLTQDDIAQASAWLQTESARLLAADDAAPEDWIKLARHGALMEREGHVALPALRKALEHPQVEVRQSAAAGLGRIGTPETVPALTAAQADPASRVARSARLALRRIALSGAD